MLSNWPIIWAGLAQVFSMFAQKAQIGLVLTGWVHRDASNKKTIHDDSGRADCIAGIDG
jgi:hypothetical protein